MFYEVALEHFIFVVYCMPTLRGGETGFWGTFTGMFSRSSPLVRYQPADVVLTFEGNRFRGSSSISRYPVICEGTFEVDYGKIRFADACFWTADFDWTYILNGEFDFSITRGERLAALRRRGFLALPFI